MSCPRCGTEIEGGFCPSCGLDISLYEELNRLRREVQDLRAALLPIPPTSRGPSDPISVLTPPAVSLEQSGNVPDRQDTGKSKQRLRESTVGQKWFLALGVVILLLGAGFFLKYAFDEQWIGPALQVSIGFGGGLLMVGAGEICRRRAWRGLEIGLGALGLGLLDLSAYAASQVYGLLPDWLTLLLVLLTSTLGGIMACLWDSRLLAGLSFFGGYLSPLLFLAGPSGPLIFFGYLIVLCLALQIIVFAKQWDFLYLLGFLFTWIAFIVWNDNHGPGTWFNESFGFTQLIFFFYSLAPFLQAFWSDRRLHPAGFLVGLPNGLLCCGWSNHLFHGQQIQSTLVALAYAILSLGLALALWRRPTLSEAAAWLVAEGTGFLLLAWVFILSGYWITAFWAIQMVALYWVALKSGKKVLVLSTILLGWLVAGRFLLHEAFPIPDAFGPLEWSWHFYPTLLARWLTALVVIGADFLIFASSVSQGIRVLRLHRWFEFFGVACLFGFLNIELLRFTDDVFAKGGMASFSVLWAVFAAALLSVGLWQRRKVYRLCAILLLLLTAAKVLLLDTADFSAPYRIVSCAVLGSVLVSLSFLYYRYSDRIAGR